MTHIYRVFTRQGYVKLLSADPYCKDPIPAPSDGWEYVRDIDAVEFIESMANGYRDPSDLLDELQFTPEIA
jgi:hypothetical protein